jgi:Fe2+ transport system protein FeoA
VLRFFSSRAASSRQLAVLPVETAPVSVAGESATPRACLLAACTAGARATVLEMRCGDAEACRLRALGVCEGASVNVLDARHAMLLDVRGTRIALGKALTAGITVQPLPG